MRYLLAILLIPGTLPLALLALRALVRAVRQSRQDEEDLARALRIQREYDVPDWAIEVAEPMGRRPVPRERPEIASRYTVEPGR